MHTSTRAALSEHFPSAGSVLRVPGVGVEGPMPRGRMLSFTLCGSESYEETTKDAAAYTILLISPLEGDLISMLDEKHMLPQGSIFLIYYKLF